MNVVWHDNIIQYFYVLVMLGNTFYVIFYYFTQVGRNELGMNDSPECMTFFMGTDGDEINTIIVIVPFGSELMSVSHYNRSCNL